MAEIYVIKRPGNLLTPANATDSELLDKFPLNAVLMATIVQPRNGQNHRRFFALLDVVMQMQDRYDNLEDLLVEFKLRTGHYQEHVTVKGVVIYIPKSISFTQMDEAEFRVFFSKCIDVALKFFCPMATRESLEAAVDQVLSFA